MLLNGFFLTVWSSQSSASVFPDATIALRCAAVIPEIGHIGWDIAITPEDAELVEGNADPGVMCQFAPHTPEKRGLWPYYQKLLKEQKETR